MRVTDAVGRFGEEVAARHLAAAGLVVLARNWRCREGELDLIARDGRVLVFVEVKTRTGTAFGVPAEAVLGRKAARIRRLAVRWLAEVEHPSYDELRFDVVSVLSNPSGVVVEHLRAAF